MNKIAEIRARRLIRQLAGGHKSILINRMSHIEEENAFPELIGKLWEVEVHDVRFYRVEGRSKMYYKVRYKPSTQRVNVGIQFYEDLTKFSEKKRGDLKLFINDSNPFKVSNIDVAKFIINNYPIKGANFKVI